MNHTVVAFNGSRQKIGWPREGISTDCFFELIQEAFSLMGEGEIYFSDLRQRRLTVEEILVGSYPEIILHRDHWAIEIQAPQSLFATLTVRDNRKSAANNKKLVADSYGTVDDDEEEYSEFAPLITEKGSSLVRRPNRQANASPPSWLSGDDNDRGTPIKEKVISTGSEDVVPVDSTSGNNDDFRGGEFQNQIIKFQRINAHLVNERTVLAWFRTNLAFITLGFKFLNLGDGYVSTERSTAIILCFCGGLFLTMLPISWWSGYYRYEKCKQMLDFDITQLEGFLYKFGFDFDNASLALVILMSCITIIFSSGIIIWSSDSS